MSDDEAEYKRQLEIQRKNFEAQFGSLEELGYEDKTKQSDTESNLSDEEIESYNEDESGSEEGGNYDSEDSHDEEDDTELSEFKGFDDDSRSQEPKPKVIKFTDPTSSSYTQPTKQQRKLLKSGKSSLAPKPIQLTKTKQKNLPEDSENLQNDLELQRFLDESHILSNFQNQQSGADLTLATLDHESGPIGKARTHTLRSRLDNISSTNGNLKAKLEKMPMSMRKGMIKSHINKINKFEQDARDGGIVLSKVKKGEFRNIGGRSVTTHDRIGKGLGNKKNIKRNKGLSIQSVGKSTRNGLVISQSEIDRINGPSKQGNFKGKRR
ncbi:hypothetical protein BN7_1852 [Wickerhamomyces ciferrii]|uniref:Protein FAF1 n=1 Tax=Wickerhamomyces ciferrii (strain ATCC 14091 / BCRC 22168 / CBS 111 / JCM 3599 / NBRC 0793 / NRRL Y-1031 F-60-10) TaxID=1206466 RepID=K0KMI4_WICCF|nr:uncharacterized protein BN7_1852 [Wickerhamomyces ciferrii]CCH42308.1 hypothetical protein BN7_1852 [Wickerhamomyces ciferrii]